jgi:rubrerythrin
MIRKDLELEQAAKNRYASQIEQFKDYSEVRTLLESVLADEEDHEVEFTRYLKEIA